MKPPPPTTRQRSAATVEASPGARGDSNVIARYWTQISLCAFNFHKVAMVLTLKATQVAGIRLANSR
jgi:hypothetical protein